MGFLSFLIKLEGNNSSFKSSLSDSESAFSTFTERVKGYAQKFTAVAAGVALIRNEFKALDEQAAKAKENIQGALRLNLDTTTFQQWKNSAEGAGSSIDTVKTSLEHLGKAQAEFITKSNAGGAGEGGALGKYFKLLGISAEDAASKSPQAIYSDLLERFKGRTMDPSQLVALQKLFGKSGGELAPMLMRGVTAGDKDDVISDRATAVFANYGKDKGSFKSAWKALKNRVMDPTDEDGDPTLLFEAMHGLSEGLKWIRGQKRFADITSAKDEAEATLKKINDQKEAQKKAMTELEELNRKEVEDAERLLQLKQDEAELDKESAHYAEIKRKATFGALDSEGKITQLKREKAALDAAAFASRIISFLGGGPGAEASKFKFEGKSLLLSEEIQALMKGSTQSHGTGGVDNNLANNLGSDARSKIGAYDTGALFNRIANAYDLNRAMLRELELIRQAATRKEYQPPAAFRGGGGGIPDTAFPL